MVRPSILAPLATLLLGMVATSASATSLSCVTINGHTTCAQSEGSLSCQTIGDRTTCSSGSTIQQYNHREQQNPPSLEGPDDNGPSATPSPPIVERKGGKLHIHAPGVDLEID